MSVSATDVKNLRDKTGAGMMDCKKALVETDGNIEKAIEFLRKKGIASAQKRDDKAANEGAVMSYIHPGNRIGVMLELNCETDFVAKTDDFQQLARDLAMHIAATNPLAVDRDDLPADVIEKETEIFRAQVLNEGKPKNIVDKIVTGKIEKYIQEITLYEQNFVKDSDKTVKEYLLELSGKLGEKMSVRRFVRYQLGEEL